MQTNNYLGLKSKNFHHATPLRIGVLLTNVGSPDAPTKKALRSYLKEFLSDPRVIELNPLVWSALLNLIILNTRPKESAKKYKEIWTDEGSPLIVITEQQRAKLAKILRERLGDQVIVEMGMGYGNPSIGSAVKKLVEQNVDRLLVLPMFPQYASATTGSTFDGLSKALTKIRRVPELRFLTQYHDEPGYINALANSIRELWEKEGEPDKLLFSFHGIPKRYFLNGDPYHCHCQKTARLVAEELRLSKERYLVAFQSLFGKEEWIKPYTINTLEELAEKGVKKVDVICPGFSADCLETIEEINGENREAFLHKGGEQFRYIPALNAREDFISFLAEFVESNLQGWLRQPRNSPEALKAREMLARQMNGN